MASSRQDLRWAAKAGAATAFCLVGAVVGAILYLGNLTYIKASTPSGSPFTRQPVQSVGSGHRQPPDIINIATKSLSPEIAQLLGKRIAAGGDITGYTLRNAYSVSASSKVPLCLTAVTTGLKAGQNGDGVEVAACTPGALSQVWIPVQYETSGITYTWLASGQYPSMCLDADDSGSGVHQGSRVQLWNCYRPPLQVDLARFSEFWDLGTWLHAMKSGATSYPLFLGSGNFSLDADDKSLQGGLPVAPVSMINHYTVLWEYWY